VCDVVAKYTALHLFDFKSITAHLQMKIIGSWFFVDREIDSGRTRQN